MDCQLVWTIGASRGDPYGNIVIRALFLLDLLRSSCDEFFGRGDHLGQLGSANSLTWENFQRESDVRRRMIQLISGLLLGRSQTAPCLCHSGLFD